jgi:hypothetical protein
MGAVGNSERQKRETKFRRDTILSATIGTKKPDADGQQKRDIWEDQWNAGRFSAE